MLAVDKTSTDDEACGASFTWAFHDLVRPAGLQYSDVAGVLAPMLAMARLLPRATESVPLGFFDIDRELTVQNFRALMAALARFQNGGSSEFPERGLKARLSLHRRPEKESDEPNVPTSAMGLEVFDRSPGLLERIRRLIIEALPPHDQGPLGPICPPWLAQIVLSIEMEKTLGEWSSPAVPAQELVCAIVSRGPVGRIYCAFEGTAGIALRLAMAGAGRVDLDLPGQTSAEFIYHLALACDLSMRVRHFHPILDAAGDETEEYDAAIANPPFNVRYGHDAHASRLPKDRSGDALHLQALLKRTRGIVVSFVADGFLFRSAQSERFFRETLIHTEDLTAVIGLPRGTFPRTSINTSLLLRIPGSKDGTQKLLVVDARKMAGAKDSARKQSPVTLTQQILDGATSEFSRLVPIQELAANEYNLQVERYILDQAAVNARQAIENEDTVLLDEVAEIIRPQALQNTADGEFSFREVSVQDVDPVTGTIREPEKYLRLTAEGNARARRISLNKNDVLLTIKGRVGVAGILIEQPAADRAWLPGQSFAVLRLRRSSPFEDPIFLHRYLSSSLGREAVTALAGGATVPFVQIADLKKIKIPIPSNKDRIDLRKGQEEIASLNSRISDLQKQIQELENALWPMNLVAKQIRDS